MLKLAAFCFLAFALDIANATPASRIVGGNIIRIPDAPYNVQLRYVNSGLFCGGALITYSHVLTAAHCMPGVTLQNLVVVAGATYSDEKGIQRRAERITVHPEYSPKTMHSDAAVIKLTQPMSGPGISIVPVCSRPVQPGSPITVTGWGRTSDEGPMSRQLQSVTFPVRTRESCLNEFHSFVQKNMFCGSGFQAKGHCFGDSGGPGVINKEICGINSFGFRCGDVGFQSAFTDVYAIRNFVIPQTQY